MLHLGRFNYNGFFILLAGMLHTHARAHAHTDTKHLACFQRLGVL